MPDTMINSSDPTQFLRTLRSAVLWPVGIIFITALLLLVFVFELFQVAKLSDHSYKVLAEMRICEDLVVSTQNSVRGYLLTGDDIFLQSFNADDSVIDAQFSKLKELVSDNPAQAGRVDDLIQAKNLWIEQGKTIIAHRAQDIPVNADWVRLGRSMLEDIRSKFDRFADAEENLRDARQHLVQHMKMALAYGGVALVILLSLTVAHVVRKQMLVLDESYRKALDTIEQRHAALARSETDLEEQKEWLRVTLTSIGDGVIVTDPTGRIVLMNHESERMTGWTNLEALHQPLTSVFKIVDEKTRQAEEDLATKILREKKVIGMTTPMLLLSRQGQECPIDDSAAPICDAQGNILGVVVVFHDATQIRLAQNSLKAYSAELEKQVADRTTTLQQAVSELEAFSYTVSHDLRSPLRAMQGFAEAIVEDYSDKLDDQGKNYLERITKAAARLDLLIQDLLSYTRISRQDIKLEPVDLDKMIHDLIERDPALNAPSAEIRIDGSFPKVLARESSLVQVIQNLLGNAAKFVPAGVVPKIRVWGEDHEGKFRLWIEDNGIGIAPKDQERIFQVFVQINDAETYRGTGVGLAIVKKAVQTMRGSVGVDSDGKSGTRFWVELMKA